MATTTNGAGVPVIARTYDTLFPPIPRTGGIGNVTAGSGSHPNPHGSKHSDVQLLIKSTYESTIGGLGVLDLSETTAMVYTPFRTLYVNIGPTVTLDTIRKAVAAAIYRAKSLKLCSLTFTNVPTGAGVSTFASLAAIAQTAQLTNYHFDRYCTVVERQPHIVGDMHIVCGDIGASSVVDTANAITHGVIYARDLANERADEMSPGRLEDLASAIATATGMTLFVKKEADLKAAGLHLMHAVGQAAREPARYVELHYAGDPENPTDKIAVVGKGITFDSGGLNVKGTGFMEDMHMDMSGAAAVLGAALAVHGLSLTRNIVFVAAVAENSLDALSYKPHNIIKSHKGLTVEVGNTDAEGRLVLADALSYLQSRHSPHTIIDLATLTGACVIALGEYAAGIFTNSLSLQDDIINAGKARGERIWPLPLLPEHKEELTTTPFADLKSTGEGRYGGACTAAAFLSNFIGNPSATPAYAPAWVHIDIAGPAMYSKDRGFMRRGGTGFGVAAVVEYLRSAPAGPRAADS